MHNPYQTTTYPRDAIFSVKFDGRYIFSSKGSLKLAQMFLGFIGYCITFTSEARICIIGEILCGITLGSLGVSAVCFTLYLYHVVEYYDMLPWLKIEFGTNTLLTVMYLSSAILSTYAAVDASGFVTLAIIAYLGVLLYGLNTGINGRDLYAGKPAQESREAEYQKAPYFVS